MGVLEYRCDGVLGKQTPICTHYAITPVLQLQTVLINRIKDVDSVYDRLQ